MSMYENSSCNGTLFVISMILLSFVANYCFDLSRHKVFRGYQFDGVATVSLTVVESFDFLITDFIHD